MVKKYPFILLLILIPLLSNAAILEYNGLRYNILKNDKIAEVVGYSTTPNGVIEIPEKVNFEGVECTVKSIVNGAFYGCSDITSLIIPNSVETIGHSAFENCIGLQSLTIGESVKTIGDCAFCYCSSLTSLTLPASVDSIGVCAFIRCYNIESIEVNENNQNFDSRNNCNAIIDKSTNTLIAGCQNTIIPETVTSIGFRAFYECSNLKSLIIPNSVTTIGDESIRDCFGLKTLTIGSGVTKIGYTALDRLESLTDIYCYATELPVMDNAFWRTEIANIDLHVIDESLEKYKLASPWSEFNSIATITSNPKGVTIGNLVYDINTDSLTAEVAEYVTEPSGDLVIPEQIEYEGTVCCVNSIGDRAFGGCANLETVTIPATIERIGYSAFINCSGLNAVYIEDLASWCNIVFENYYGNPLNAATRLYLDGVEVNNLVIPNGVKTISAEAFRTCKSLVSVVLPEGLEHIGVGAFCNCYNLESIIIPKSLKFIGENAFFDTGLDTSLKRLNVYYQSDIPSWCNIDFENRLGSLQFQGFKLHIDSIEVNDLVIPDGITKINRYAFAYCDIQSVVIPSTVDTIGLDAFANSSIEEIHFSEGLKVIEQGAFYNCDALTSVSLPNSINCLHGGVFLDCSGLNHVTIGCNVDSIGPVCFNSPNLKDMFCYSDDIPQIDATLDSPFNNGMTLYVPKSSLEAYRTTSPWSEIETIKAIMKYEDVAIGNLTYNINLESQTAEVTGYVDNPVGELVIPEYVEYMDTDCKVCTIGSTAFEGCRSIESISIPSSVTTIGNFAFGGCWELKNLSIPFGVETIGIDAFANCTKLESISLPESLDTLKRGAFYNCDSLTEVDIPNNVKSIGGGAFQHCYSLHTVIIGCGVDSLAPNCFSSSNIKEIYCFAVEIPKMDSSHPSPFAELIDKPNVTLYIPEESLDEYSTTSPWSEFGTITGYNRYSENVTIGELTYNINLDNQTAEVTGFAGETFGREDLVIPSSIEYMGLDCDVKSIADNAFWNHSNFSFLSLPNSITTIGDYAFGGLNKLIFLDIPNSVRTIGIDAFANCTILESVSLSENLDTLKKGAFYNCNLLTEVNIPNSVKSIGGGAFQDCDSLQTVIIGCGVDSLAPNCFSSLNIKEIYCHAVNTPKTDANNPSPFSWCDKQVAILYVPTESLDTYKSTSPWSEFANIIAITQDVKEVIIGNFIYRINTDSLTAEVKGYAEKPAGVLTIPRAIEHLGNNYDVISIGAFAFADCSNVDSIAMPNSIKQIGKYAFKNCTNLSIVTIPENVKTIKHGAFYGCTGVTSIYIPRSVISIEDAAFTGCTSLTAVNISDLAAWCNIDFGNDASLSDYSNPLYYARHLYTNGIEIKDLVLPHGLKEIKHRAFVRCDGLRSVTIPEGVQRIGIAAFRECSGLTSIRIPDSVEEISAYAFCYSSNIGSLIIGKNVRLISQLAFFTCPITEVYSFAQTPPIDYGSSIILNSTLYIPEQLSEAYYMSSPWNEFDTIITFTDYTEDVAIDNLTYNINLDSLTAEVSGYVEAPSGNLVIPESITYMGKTCKVNGIGHNAFRSTYITSVTIPNSIEHIGPNAFTNTYGLHELHISDLEKWCNIDFGEGNEYGYNPFCGKYSKHSMYLNGNKIVDLIIPDGITRINSFAFSYSDFESIKLPNTVKSIGLDAFAYSYKLAEIHFSEELEIIEQGAFYRCDGLNSISLPNSVTTLHGGAFHDCYNLKTVSVGCNIDSIGPNCFNSSGLMDIYCYTVDVPQTDTTLESPFMSGTTLHVPEEALEAYKTALYPWNGLYDIVAIEKPKVDVSIGSTGATTFCSEYDLDFSDIDGIKAYVATGYNTATGAITMMRVTKVKGGTGLYIKGEAGQYSIPIVEDVTFNTLNMIVGVTEQTLIEPEDGEQTNFVYTRPSGKSAAFYRLTSQRTIPAGKAYLQIPTLWLPVDSESKLKMVFDDGTVTYIENIEISDNVQNSTIYDLQGRSVTNPTKGIYIVNGKKVIYK